MSKFRLAILLLAFGVAHVARAQVEIYGPATIARAYNGLGTNITPTNAWEYADARAAHITWGRFDCGWIYAETILSGNVSGGYTMPSSCAAGLLNSVKYGVHPMMNALYGAPYAQIAAGTTKAAVASGAIAVSLSITSGSLAQVVPGQTYLSLNSGAFLSPKYSYPGVLITAVNGATVTLASAANTSLAEGSGITVNLQLYAPVLIAPGANYLSNASVQAYGNYAAFLARQINAAGITGAVSIWNEPPWCCDEWDHAANLYDTPPANGDINRTLGMELPLYVADMANVPGVAFDSGYAESAMWNGAFFNPANASYIASIPQLQAQFGTESFHTYSNDPEDYIWNQACVAENATPAPVSNILAGNCTPPGLWTGATDGAVVAANSFPSSNGGVPHSVTETGLCRDCGVTTTETQIARYDLRDFLSAQAVGLSPVMFYRMSEDPEWEWVNSITLQPYPVYTAFKNLMADMSAVANAPVAAYTACQMPRVESYSGSWPLATMSFVGAKSGYKGNSILYYTWQRTWGWSPDWEAVKSPAAVPIKVEIPAGTSVYSIKDMVTDAAVSYTLSNSVLSYKVADDPVEVWLNPTRSSTLTSPQCI